MIRLRTVAVAALSVLATGCSDGPTPLEPSSDPTPSFTLADASGPQGLQGFHFRAPISDEATPTENLDASLLDLLSVEICEWSGVGCVLPLVREITSELDSPERLHVSDEAVYTTVWSTRRDDLDPERTYRIRVLASGGELGYVDVDVVKPGSDSRQEGDEDHVHLVAGQALSIGFVIEQGTGARAGGGGGVVELAEGQVVLDLPEGALEGDVLLTATPTDDVPAGGPPIVPGTAWDFGPDGLEFEHPVFMTLAFDPAAVPPGVDPNELRIHKVVDGEFVQQNAGLVDLENNTVSAEVDGFSVFVVIPRDPENPEDILPPEVRSMSVFDPTTGTWGPATTLELSSSDATLNFRIEITDNITGVDFIDVRWISPGGRQVRFPCFTGAPPTSGSDTNGQWDCQTDFPQYSEAGVWQPQLVIVEDRINNSVFYSSRSSGFCDSSGTQCVTDIPAITVSSVPEDIDPPVVQAVQVSADVQPRMFGPSVSVDASSGFQWVYFGIQATDDLSGVGGGFFFDRIEMQLRGPSNQFRFQRPFCQLTQGTTLDGFWECRFFIPEQAESGMWNMDYLRVPDRVGNGGWSGFSDFRPDGSGQLCNPGGNCVTPPTVEVVSAGDGEPPSLASVGIALDGSDVVTTTLVTDDISGVSSVRIRYNSVETTQFQDCFASLNAGTPNAGSWSCTISFSEFAARGQWVLSVEVWDVAGNRRFYFRRASDGFLCYFDPDTSSQVCQDFGDTDLILE